MAAHKENLLSLGHLNDTERNIFTKQTQHSFKKSVNRSVLLQSDFSTLQTHQQLRAMQLQQRWQELKQRELTAQQHNRQLLQQFEEAQNTLREMLTLNTAMKTIRMEYERYLEENAPHWQQQFKEKTRAAQKKRMEDYMNSRLKNTEDLVTKSSADRPLHSQGPTTKPQKVAPPLQHYSQNNQDGSHHLSYMQSSWLTNPQSHSARNPIRAPYQPQGSTHVPPSFLPPPIYSHPLQLHHLASTPAHHHQPPWPRQNPPGRATPQPDYPWSWTAEVPSGSEALWGQLHTEEPPPEREVVQEAETSRAANSKRDRGGGSRSSHLSQELDIKPVRLSSGGPAESSESSRESSQASREKRKKREKRGRSRRTPSDRERLSSQESSRTSSVIIAAAVTPAQSSESDAPSEKGRTSTGRRSRRSAGLSVGSPRADEVVKERNRSNGDDSGSPREEESPSTAEESRSEEAGDRSPDNKSESCREESGSQKDEESGSVSINIENGGGDEIEKEETSSSEESNVGEKDKEDKEEEQEQDLRDGEKNGEEKEDSQKDEEQEERDVEDDDEASERKNTTEEEDEETGAEEEVEEQDSDEEKSDKLKNEDGENVKQDSTSSQDEEVDEDDSIRGEDKIEEDGESDEEEEVAGGEEEEDQRGDEAGDPEEERDSDDSIISPPNKPKRMHIIPEEASEDEDDEEEAGEEEEEEQGEEPEEERDSDDSIISPQNKSKKMSVIPEETIEDEDDEKEDEEEDEEEDEDEEEEEKEKGSNTGFSDDDSNEFSDEDIEHLLAPQEQSQKKEEKDLKADEKPKEICDKVEIFVGSTKMDQQSDSEEFDHFYD